MTANARMSTAPTRISMSAEPMTEASWPTARPIVATASGGADSCRCEPDQAKMLRQGGHGCSRAGMPAPSGRRLTLLALPVGPAAGVIDGVGQRVLGAAGQVALARHGGRARRQPAHVALSRRRQLRRARCSEGVVLAELEGVAER